MKAERFDIVIVGGGVVGLTQALALADAGFTVALVERHPRVPMKPAHEETRVFAINFAVEQIFKNLKVWDAMTERKGPIERMKIWDRFGDEELCFDSMMRRENHLGTILEQQLILKALYRRIDEHSLATVLIDTPRSLCMKESFVECEGRRLQADVIIGCDGVQSWVRSQLALECPKQSYGQCALVATFQCEREHQRTAYQCFHPTGPIALLPLSDPHQVSLVWSLEESLAQKMVDASKADFEQAVMTHVESTLGKLIQLATRQSFPLSKHQAQHYFRDQCVLVGDAAHAIHPLAGQGLNLGILDAALLSDALVSWRMEGKCRLKHWLSWYQRHRRSHVTMLMNSMDLFHHLYKSKKLPMIGLRNRGFKQVNRLSLLKHFLIDFAMGTRGFTIPSLGRIQYGDSEQSGRGSTHTTF